MAKPPERSAGEVNRAHWDALVAVHGTGNDYYYDVDALAAGTRGLAQVSAGGNCLPPDCVPLFLPGRQCAGQLGS